MSKLSLEERIRHKITHPYVGTELGTNFLMDNCRNCSVSRGKADILQKQLQFCHHLSVMPVYQQTCVWSLVVLLHRYSRSQLVIQRYCP